MVYLKHLEIAVLSVEEHIVALYSGEIVFIAIFKVDTGVFDLGGLELSLILISSFLLFLALGRKQPYVVISDWNVLHANAWDVSLD